MVVTTFTTFTMFRIPASAQLPNRRKKRNSLSVDLHAGRTTIELNFLKRIRPAPMAASRQGEALFLSGREIAEDSSTLPFYKRLPRAAAESRKSAKRSAVPCSRFLQSLFSTQA